MADALETSGEPQLNEVDWADRLEDLRLAIAAPLRALHAPLDQWLDSLPMWVAQVCAIGLFVVAGLWVLTLSRDFVYLGSPTKSRWRDLRLWSIALLLPYIAVYWWLGR
ncbi:MAG: hypothetical protein K2Y37_11990 [Pirellulales bacterium]|nr:hypothetical protein [Pirellulales bacterium]